MSNMLAPFRGSQFPTKIMWPHRNNLARVLGISRANSSQFSGLFPDAKWIHVYRDDIFMQAISMWRAKKSGRWHVYARDQSSEPAIEYDFDAIDDCIWELALHNRLWQDFFTISGIVPYEVNYEAIVNDVKLVLVPLLDHLGLDSSNPVIYVPLRKQGDDLTREFRDRLMEDLFRIGR
ncbi:Stf0 family sulfotransferase [Polymorphobacter fuscus]|nr:Stf0 family sulfotransferase [Polymorphobacter fuscus]NJC07847.1 LPS sulfotransferase NodH [Polymorphobacter fuscus]